VGMPRRPKRPKPLLPQVERGTADVVADMIAENGRLAEELRQANDRALRSQAELENFRKRMRREMEEERRYVRAATSCGSPGDLGQSSARD